MLYNVLLVSAVKQSESAIGIHISTYPFSLVSPSHPPYPTTLVTKHRADLPVLCGCFPIDICFTFGTVHMSVLLSHFIPAYPSLPHCVLKSILYVCVFIPVPSLGLSEPFIFKIPYICVSIQYLFFSF